MKASIGITVGIVLGTALLLLIAHLGWRWRHRLLAYRRRLRPQAVKKVQQVDLTGEEVRPFTSVSPITMCNDAKYTYSPAFPTPLRSHGPPFTALSSAGPYPTPLRSAAAFFPYAPPLTNGSFGSPTGSSSLGRNRAMARDDAADEVSNWTSEVTGMAQSNSESGTSGQKVTAIRRPASCAKASTSDKGSSRRSSGSRAHTAGASSEFSLVRLYQQGESSRSGTS